MSLSSFNSSSSSISSQRIHLDPAVIKASRRGSQSSCNDSVRSFSTISNGSGSSKIAQLGVQVASWWDRFATAITFGYSNRATKVSFDGGHTFKWLKTKSLSNYVLKVIESTDLVTKPDRKLLEKVKTNPLASGQKYDLEHAVLQGFIDAAKKANSALSNQNEENTPVCIGNFLKRYVVIVEDTSQTKGKLVDLFSSIHKFDSTVYQEDITEVDEFEDQAKQAWSAFFSQFEHVLSPVKIKKKNNVTQIDLTRAKTPEPSHDNRTFIDKAGQTAKLVQYVAKGVVDELKSLPNSLWHSVMACTL